MRDRPSVDSKLTNGGAITNEGFGRFYRANLVNSPPCGGGTRNEDGWKTLLLHSVKVHHRLHNQSLYSVRVEM
jgi:hypothetical protein